VNGKIVKDGQPFTLSDKGQFVLLFVNPDDQAKSFNASVKADGTFTIVGPANKGIPPGKYRVQLQAMDPYAPGGGTDKLGGKYGPNSKSPMMIDVGPGELVIEVGK
jgi:hypothetical protein